MIVLCYHKVCHVEHDWNGIVTSPDTFRKQIQYIKEVYGFISAEEFVEDFNTDKVLLTFDDGFEDNYINVLPILEEMRVPAIFFVSTETLGKRAENWCNELVWLLLEGIGYPEYINLRVDEKNEIYRTETLEERLKTYKNIRNKILGVNKKTRNKIFQEIRNAIDTTLRRKRDTHYMLSTEQLRLLAQSKYVSIGCHTVSHCSLALLSEKEQYEEIKQSKDVLERVLGRTIEQFAYPFGGIWDYSLETVKILENLGFKAAFSTTYKRWSREESKYEIPRICINECSFEEFREKIETYRNKISYCFEEES